MKSICITAIILILILTTISGQYAPDIDYDRIGGRLYRRRPKLNGKTLKSMV